jgi:hypothetical protein
MCGFDYSDRARIPTIRERLTVGVSLGDLFRSVRLVYAPYPADRQKFVDSFV